MAGDILTNETIKIEKRKIPLQRKVEWISNNFPRDIFRQWRFAFKYHIMSAKKICKIRSLDINSIT